MPRSDLPAEIAQDLLAYIALTPFPTVTAPESEDCAWMVLEWLCSPEGLLRAAGLSVTVQVPAGIKSGANLPVLAVSRYVHLT